MALPSADALFIVAGVSHVDDTLVITWVDGLPLATFKLTQTADIQLHMSNDDGDAVGLTIIGQDNVARTTTIAYIPGINVGDTAWFE